MTNDRISLIEKYCDKQGTMVHGLARADIDDLCIRARRANELEAELAEVIAERDAALTGQGLQTHLALDEELQQADDAIERAGLERGKLSAADAIQGLHAELRQAKAEGLREAARMIQLSWVVGEDAGWMAKAVLKKADEVERS